VATLSNLIERVRLELGDLSKSFVEQIIADGTTNRFDLENAPVEGLSLNVTVNGDDVSDAVSVEERTGVIVLDEIPEAGDIIIASGNHFRYFTDSDMETLVLTALEQHSGRRTDVVGRDILTSTLPKIEEYPVAIYATTLALYTLATDASFDINIFAPDGVTIPRSERYRQLMEMISERKEQYKELCVQLGIGMFQIEVFSLRRISKRTNRYVPVYKPMEVDDRSWAQRVKVPAPTYGSAPLPWITEGPDLLAYQGVAFSGTVDFSGNFEGKSFIAFVTQQRGSVQVIQNFVLSVNQNEDQTYTASISLTKDQTLRLFRRTYWTIQQVDDITGDKDEIIGGDFFTERRSEVIL
jgi:hypothetical protein